MLVTPITTTAPGGRLLGLTVGRTYEVLGIEADMYRLLTNEDHPRFPNDPVLFEPQCFQIIDDSEPSFWVCETGDEEERYAYPPSWNRIGFFEDLHDNTQTAVDQFWNDLRDLYPRTWNERFT